MLHCVVSHTNTHYMVHRSREGNFVNYAARCNARGSIYNSYTSYALNAFSPTFMIITFTLISDTDASTHTHTTTHAFM